jgi:hypothetical protein
MRINVLSKGSTPFPAPSHRFILKSQASTYPCNPMGYRRSHQGAPTFHTRQIWNPLTQNFLEGSPVICAAERNKMGGKKNKLGPRYGWADGMAPPLPAAPPRPKHLRALPHVGPSRYISPFRPRTDNPFSSFPPHPLTFTALSHPDFYSQFHSLYTHN